MQEQPKRRGRKPKAVDAPVEPIPQAKTPEPTVERIEPTPSPTHNKQAKPLARYNTHI